MSWWMPPATGPDEQGVSASIAHGPGWAILHDPALIGEPTPLLFDPDHWASRVVGVAGRGRGRALFLETSDGQQWALRHYLRGGLAGRVIADVYPWLGAERTRPFREWRMLAHLHAAGLPVPRPVAAGWRRAGLGYRADLVTVRIPAVEPLSGRLAAGRQVDWSMLGRLLARFHAAGACHADLNAHNILLDDQGGAWLLDFDRGRLRAPGAWREANLARLERSLRKIAAEDGAPAFDAAGWAALRAAYAEASASG